MRDLFVLVLKYFGHYGLWLAIGGGLLLLLAGVVMAGSGRRR